MLPCSPAAAESWGRDWKLAFITDREPTGADWGNALGCQAIQDGNSLAAERKRFG